uniref:ARAD1C45364p n=1 Tax=Blastobotrys adeninivorans TaxID=409370 RepID=A0A060T9K0_BLAAD
MLFAITLVAILARLALAEYEPMANVWSSYYAVPGALLNHHDLNAMGLTSYLNNSKALDMQKLGRSFTLDATSNPSPLLVPNNSSLMFLFNTSSPLTPYADPESVFSDVFFHASLPLGLPRYHYLVDAVLLVPKKDVEFANATSIVTASQWLSDTGFDRSNIPLFQGMLEPNKPIVMFVFRGERSLHDFASPRDMSSNRLESMSFHAARSKITDALLSSSSEVARAVIASNGNFFDNFARIWINTFDSNTLFYSLFCQVNSKVTELNYCLKIGDGDATISLISTNPYDPVAPLAKRQFYGEDYPDSEDTNEHSEIPEATSDYQSECSESTCDSECDVSCYEACESDCTCQTDFDAGDKCSDNDCDVNSSDPEGDCGEEMNKVARAKASLHYAMGLIHDLLHHHHHHHPHHHEDENEEECEGDELVNTMALGIQEVNSKLEEFDVSQNLDIQPGIARLEPKALRDRFPEKFKSAGSSVRAQGLRNRIEHNFHRLPHPRPVKRAGRYLRTRVIRTRKEENKEPDEAPAPYVEENIHADPDAIDSSLESDRWGETTTRRGPLEKRQYHHQNVIQYWQQEPQRKPIQLIEKRGLRSLPSKSPEQGSSQDSNCTDLTWKGVFLHSLFGEPAAFC